MITAIKILGVVAAGYAALVGGMYVFQRSVMYFPSSHLPTPTEVGAPEFRIARFETADGLELTSWYAPGSADGVAIVYFQGNGGNLAHRAARMRPFLDAGYGVLLAGYRGYGGNPGSPSEQGLFADGHAALDFLARQGVKEQRVVLLGESLGSGVAVALATERAVGALMLEAPFTSAADVGQRAYPLLPVRLLIKDRFDSLSRIPRIGAPLLLIHGERDQVVPVDLGRRLLAAAPEPKQGVFLPNAGHNDLHGHGAAQIELEFVEGLFGNELRPGTF